MNDLSRAVELAGQVEDSATATVDLLEKYADRAGLLEGALGNIAAMLDGVVTGIVPATEVRAYARDVLARAGCESAQAGR